MKNPQAFPQFSFTIDGHPHEPGMTLRDHFAGKALHSVFLLCRHDELPIEETREQLFARRCYAMADAMLAEREK